MQVQSLHCKKKIFSKVFGYYNCVTIVTVQKIHEVGADIQIKFIRLPQNVLQALDALN